MIVEIVNRNFVILKRLGLSIVGLLIIRPVLQDILKIVLQRELTQMNGCGNCTSATCKTCTGHRCNDGKNFPYYCLKSDGTSLLECPSPNCYIDKSNGLGIVSIAIIDFRV
ncbi:unnamed protein product [Meloidogyne enterolobii]|uniref:Uncharacterized protein n=1 Tax=Meloidogyne enterolobii TaxID=390850 RepID=A0ACB1B3J1_MELEN